MLAFYLVSNDRQLTVDWVTVIKLFGLVSILVQSSVISRSIWWRFAFKSVASSILLTSWSSQFFFCFNLFFALPDFRLKMHSSLHRRPSSSINRLIVCLFHFPWASHANRRHESCLHQDVGTICGFVSGMHYSNVYMPFKRDILDSVVYFTVTLFTATF